jgi:hypothetical protein
MAMKVTFDTNTLDKAVRLERFCEDPNRFLFDKVRPELTDWASWYASGTDHDRETFTTAAIRTASRFGAG